MIDCIRKQGSGYCLGSGLHCDKCCPGKEGRFIVMQELDSTEFEDFSKPLSILPIVSRPSGLWSQTWMSISFLSLSDGPEMVTSMTWRLWQDLRGLNIFTAGVEVPLHCHRAIQMPSSIWAWCMWLVWALQPMSRRLRTLWPWQAAWAICWHSTTWHCCS